MQLKLQFSLLQLSVVGFSLATAMACSAGDGGSGTDSSADSAMDGPSSGGAGTGGLPGSVGGTQLTGGTGGVAGVGGGSGGAGTGGTTMVGCTGSEILCEDFEDTAVDQTPGTPWLAKDSSCQYASQFALGVSEERAHLGTKALRIENTSYAQCRISAALGDHDEFWLRAFVYWDAAVDFSSREVLEVDLHPASGLGKDDPAVRFGNRSKAPCEASAGPQITIIGLAGGEQTGCSTTKAIPKGSWYCFEAHVTQTDKVVVETFIDRTKLQYTSVGKPTTDTIETPSASTEKINHLRLGMFGTTSTTGNVFIDDVAVAATRLGCGD